MAARVPAGHVHVVPVRAEVHADRRDLRVPQHRRRTIRKRFDPARQHAVGDYDIVTHNGLLGLQIGADMTFRQCRWAWGIESKVGPYINFGNQTSTIDAAVLDGPARPAYDQQLAANPYQAALIGEVGFQATYKFRPNLMGRAAYDFMWISGVALAPEQLQFVANPTITSAPTAPSSRKACRWGWNGCGNAPLPTGLLNLAPIQTA